MSQAHPPKWPLKCLRWFCKEDMIDEIEGDLFEMFLKRSTKSIFKARCFFIWNVLRSFRRTNLKTFRLKFPVWTLSFVQTWRFLKRDGVYSILNALSLAIGFVVTILFVWYAEEELSFDSFHEKRDRIYRVSFNQYIDLGSYASTSYPIGPAMKKDFPEIQAMTRLGGIGRTTVRYEDRAFFETINLADEDFFKIFDFPLILGDPNTALKEHNQLVISESMAQKYFPDENPIGKLLVIGSGGNYDARITGVFADIPSNSHIDVDMVMSYATLYHQFSFMETLWQQMPRNYTYVLLNQESQAASLQDKLEEIEHRYVSDLERGEYDLMLIPLKEVHFYEGLYNENLSNKSFDDLITFGLVVLIILCIGTINFANLTSSRYLTRIKEVGVRKVLGAGSSQLLLQLLFQSFLLAVFSLAFAYLMIGIMFPFVNELAAKAFNPGYFLEPITLITSLVLIVGVTLLASIIPAVKLSAMGFLKSSRDMGSKPQKGLSKKSYLMLFQYLATFFLMVSSLVMYEQLSFMDDKVDRGTSSRLVIPINANLSDHVQLLEESLEAYPYVLSAAASSHVPSFYGDSWPVRTGMEASPVQTENFVITEDYLDVMSYKILAGRALSRNLQTDINSGFVVNETCVKMLGFSSLEEAIGQTIIFGSDEPKEGKIIGVTEDFHFESFREKISPALFQFKPYDWMNHNFLILKVPEHEVVRAIELAENEIAKTDPDWVVEASFYEANFKRRFLQETAQGQMTVSLTFVAILLTCLGQVGLILHYVFSRQKEMAVRKVLGASVKQLWILMTRSYFGLMLVAIVMAVPLSVYLLNEWLSGFHYRIQLGPEPFFLAATVACILVISVISAVALNSARRNPVESLSEE